MKGYCIDDARTVAAQDPEGFVEDMASMFDQLNATDIADHTSEIMAAMMDTIRKYQVLSQSFSRLPPQQVIPCCEGTTYADTRVKDRSISTSELCRTVSLPTILAQACQLCRRQAEWDMNLFVLSSPATHSGSVQPVITIQSRQLQSDSRRECLWSWT